MDQINDGCDDSQEKAEAGHRSFDTVLVQRWHHTEECLYSCYGASNGKTELGAPFSCNHRWTYR